MISGINSLSIPDSSEAGVEDITDIVIMLITGSTGYLLGLLIIKGLTHRVCIGLAILLGVLLIPVFFVTVAMIFVVLMLLTSSSKEFFCNRRVEVY